MPNGFAASSGRKSPSVANLTQAFPGRALKHSYPVARMFEFMDVSPDLRLPFHVVRGRFPTSRASRVETVDRSHNHRPIRQLQEHAAHFFNFSFVAYQVFVAQKVPKSQLSGFLLGFFTGMKRTVFGSQLLGRIASHPENVLVRHAFQSPAQAILNN